MLNATLVHCPFVCRREAVKQAMVIDTTETEITSRSKAGTLLCAKKHHKKKKRTSFRSNYGKGDLIHLNCSHDGLFIPVFLYGAQRTLKRFSRTKRSGFTTRVPITSGPSCSLARPTSDARS